MRDEPVYDYRQRLLVARELSGKTQAQAAKAAGMPMSTLAEAETNAKRPGYTVRLARTYGVDPFWLETGKGQEPAGLRGESGVTPSSGQATPAAEDSTSAQLEHALNMLVDAFGAADALTAAQVKPLFSMLFETKGLTDPNVGTIARRIAELLRSVTRPSGAAVSSTSKTTLRTSRLAGRKAIPDGTSGTDEGGRGQSDDDQRSRGNARKG